MYPFSVGEKLLALLTHSGAGSTDLGTLNTKREDISDWLLASLVPENNFLGLIDIGPEIGDTQFRWLEDRLNNNTVADASGAAAGGNTAGPPAGGATTNFTLSAADAAILDVGWILADEAATALNQGVPGSELIQVVSISGTTVGMLRGYGNTTPTVHGINATYRVIAAPVYENSDLGRDMSRARITKLNAISRFELNVNISSEQIERALAGYAPGVPDELQYQFEARLRELLRRMNQSLLYSRVSSNTAPGTGDYSTMAGCTQFFLDGTFNGVGAGNLSNSNQAGSALSDTILNSQNKTMFRNGALNDWIVVGANGAEALGRLYNDRIRLEQNDRGRGFWAKYFDTSLGNTLRIVMDNAIYDTAPFGMALLLDSGRIRIRPFKNSFFYLIQAPTFRDGDAVRALSKWSLELRNAAGDVGAAHVLVTGLAF